MQLSISIFHVLMPLAVATYLGWQVIGYCLREPFPWANLAVSLKLVKRMKDGSQAWGMPRPISSISLSGSTLIKTDLKNIFPNLALPSFHPAKKNIFTVTLLILWQLSFSEREKTVFRYKINRKTNRLLYSLEKPLERRQMHRNLIFL